MASSAIDSEIFGNLFGTPAMRHIFADETLIQRYLDVEAALARVQARMGIIPEAAAAEITAKASFEHFDFEEYKRGVARVSYPILPLVEGIVAMCKDGLGEYSPPGHDDTRHHGQRPIAANSRCVGNHRSRP